MKVTTRKAALGGLAMFGAAVLLAGCGGPTRTAGTRGVATSDLAVLSIPQVPDESPVLFETVQFDGAGDPYAIGKGRDFYLLPGDHTATFTLIARTPRIPGVAGWFAPKPPTLRIAAPGDIPLGSVTAGKIECNALPRRTLKGGAGKASRNQGLVTITASMPAGSFRARLSTNWPPMLWP